MEDHALIWEITQFFVCLYFNKTGGKKQASRGIITYEKKNVIHAVYEYIDIPPGRLLTL